MNESCPPCLYLCSFLQYKSTILAAVLLFMKFEDLLAFLTGAQTGRITVGRGGNATMARLACELVRRGRPVALLAGSTRQRLELKALCQLFSPALSKEDQNPAIAAWEQPLIQMASNRAGAPGQHENASRVSGLFALHVAEKPFMFLSCADNFLIRHPPRTLFESHTITLRVNEDTSQEGLVQRAVEWGYQRTAMVTQPGELAVRGDILDIYAPGYAHPVRVEFFGDSVEQIRMFDASTQRSVGTRDEAVILPAGPAVFSRELVENAEKYWEKLGKSGKADGFLLSCLADELSKTGHIRGIMPGLFYEQCTSLISWLPENTVFLIPDEAVLGEAVESFHMGVRGAGAPAEEDVLAQPAELVFLSARDFEAELAKKARVVFNELPVEETGANIMWDADSKFDLPERRIHSFQDMFPLASDRERPWHRFVEQLKEWKAQGKTLVLSFPSCRSRGKFLNLIGQDDVVPAQEFNPDQPGVYALVSPWSEGVELSWADMLVLGEDVIQPCKEGHRVKSRAFAGLDRYDDLKPGDHLVHRDFGIGRFEGLHNLKLGGHSADFLLLVYANDDKFYLPVDRLSLVQRFKGADGLTPPLDKLGGSAWQASKSKAKKAIEQIAHDLLEMYAFRKLAKGYSYGPVNELFSEFEASFGFEETPDQARTIEDVLEDMDKPEAMDRLVCGDVGFGKTEVALRAAFRAGAAGKQVALLCPTTVLAEQHYKTFTSRLSAFGLNVGLLSRFVTRKEQEAVLEKAAKGLIDVLIGTHRLLSGDVKLPNLSLLILDEEQHFGVRHKEKLKQLRKNIDVLTLTATPIPRTLQLSIAGLRDLSIIETAPPERKPVVSTVAKRDDLLLAGVLARELERDGQVFWVNNRVQGIERVVEYVQKLAPGAKIGLAHGQMPERQLEDSMHKFWHGETQILVCTAIIESGLDLPRANTLVVDGAQMFGLGQLYQLRGRVGRSDRQAYAVFVAPQEISGKAGQFSAFRERLRVIMDMDYLGAGFQVAMEDLRIRGAGNILGEVQSGHMARVGLDLYLEMLEETVNRIRGDKTLEVRETELSIGMPALIPATYIEDSGERLNYYKALSSASDAQSQQNVELEIRDRFGPMPDEVINFISVLGLKRFLSRLQVAKADIFENRIRLYWMSSSQALDPECFVNWVAAAGERAKVLPQNGLEYSLDMNLALPDRLLAVCDDMQELL